ncbi:MULTISPECIES: biotin--[acetyl-CoA-carboxylase] ligase [Cetobacterium]|uniref:Biotin--[acetyl-CoA-carboxylase] ligase n=1 Tax=Candidatus Cetobacterium colombiensis TaxID=3073100 RepID=A0ABU4WCT6_9FUSO|nr:biotin--[acetyl-CoA-carboxylase] ligase [Candidatus Cetobacterium colombiensis]MDX8336519.1 biotin--[acetyl-CoA-carboxylase] ligase [Candidatus Cetobacterium colombiensis]
MKVYKFEEIDSTNKFLREKEDVSEKDLVIAKVQTNGRGRRGNKWVSTEGAALFSFVLKHDMEIPEDEYMKLPLLVGYSLLYTLKKIEDLDFKFKWTNDLFLDDKKISGILVEKIKDNYIIGIGLNVNNENLEEAKNIAISLKEKTGKKYDLDKVIMSIVEDFFINFKAFKSGEWKEILEKINKVNYLYGKRINIVSFDKEESGIAGDILENGMLEVFVGNEIKAYNIGTIHISKK